MADTSGLDAVTADLGANLVSVLILLLVAIGASQLAAPKAQTFPAQQVPPLSGPAQSDLLYLRLNPDPATLVIELTPAGAFAPATPGRMVPLGSLTDPWPPQAAIFVFSNTPHRAFLDQATHHATTLHEITVPDALRAKDPAPGASAFSPAFLSLPQGSKAAFRPALLRLLTQGSTDQGGGTGTGATGGLLHRLRHAALLTLNLIGFLLTLWALRRLSRRLRLQL